MISRKLEEELKMCTHGELARELKMSQSELSTLLREDLSLRQEHLIEVAIFAVVERQSKEEGRALASHGLGEKRNPKAKYINLIQKHLCLSLPMQPHGKRYTGQGHDYYEGYSPYAEYN